MNQINGPRNARAFYHVNFSPCSGGSQSMERGTVARGGGFPAGLHNRGLMMHGTSWPAQWEGLG